MPAFRGRRARPAVPGGGPALERLTWRAVDASGAALASGTSPAAALAAAPVVPWPVTVVGDGDRRVSVAEALGPGGDGVARLLDALVRADPEVDVAGLARDAPGGPVDLPLAVVALAEGVEAAAAVDPAWLAEVDRLRAAPRQALADAGRAEQAEAALHLALLVATDRLDPADDADTDAHVASGAQLWLLAGAVVSVLAGTTPDPFSAWARLVTAGWWPVGPSGGRLVVAKAGAVRRPG